MKRQLWLLDLQHQTPLLRVLDFKVSLPLSQPGGHSRRLSGLWAHRSESAGTQVQTGEKEKEERKKEKRVRGEGRM